VATTQQDENWIEEIEDDSDEYPVEYNISSTPNDFNVKTIFDFVSSGIVKIPGFQRNYVWDIKKASRLIESLIMGLPVPQVFFYERAKNDFLVIDGQQRLMTVYYFLKKRFPKMEKRAELRRIFDEKGEIPENILSNDDYFDSFNLKLAARILERENRLEGLNYGTLDRNDRTTVELRTIRCVVIKQYDPKDDPDSSMYEIFYRLNTGGVNLTPQEIRACVYYSGFYEMLSEMNLDPRWRRLTKPDPDIRMRDLESLLRGFAMLVHGNDYRSPMVKFLNSFSEESKKFSEQQRTYLKQLFNSFMNHCEDLPQSAFGSASGRFSISMYEAIFAAVCEKAYRDKTLDISPVSVEKLDRLKLDPQFLKASQSQTTDKENVDLRLRKAKEILLN
jgi:uncharacterized protein with ParB-like and HNH nuclease domain